MKSRILRTITVLAVIVVIMVGFFTNWGIGTLSAPGFFDISLLCPMGALTTMLATKMMLPRGVISLVVMIALIILFARAFCAWVCPIPLVSNIRNLFKKRTPQKKKASIEAAVKGSTTDEVPEIEGVGVEAASQAAGRVVEAQGGKPIEENPAVLPGTGTSAEPTSVAATFTTPLSDAEKEALSSGCEKPTKGKSACSSCAKKRGAALDARHFVLGGALVSTAAFGFPVFCLVCPIGLTFATIFLVICLFSGGDVTWSLVFVPLLLAAEVIFFRKWCHKLCPLGAMMSLIAKANKTFVPTIDDTKCLETAKGVKCGICGRSCPEEIDPRHPNTSKTTWSECSKCRECVDACPTGAITMPLLPNKRSKPSKKEQEVSKGKRMKQIKQPQHTPRT